MRSVWGYFLLQIYCSSIIVKFTIGVYLPYMNWNKIRTTFRLERAREGHSEAARELLDEVIAALKNEAQLSFEHRNYLLWGLEKLKAKKNDPFNLLKTKLKGDVHGPVTQEEIKWEAYLAVTQFIEQGHTLTISKKSGLTESAAPELAAEYLQENYGIARDAATIETYYKEIHADLICAEAVWKRGQEFESEFGDDFDKAVALAAEDIKKNTKISHSPERLRKAYRSLKQHLVD